MQQQQTIFTPSGITVFGSSLIRVAPDIVSFKFSVERRENQPKDAFYKAREAAKNVQQYLSQTGQRDYGASHITLKQSFLFRNGEQQLLGYDAKVGFHMLLRDLGRVEELLIGITDAGVNKIETVDYQSSQLKQHRAEARANAIIVAKEKAETYCRAAQVSLGDVIHIEDVNPNQLRGGEGHVRQQPIVDDENTQSAFDPNSISVGGAVKVTFKFADKA